jgi:hypothetical protein
LEDIRRQAMRRFFGKLYVQVLVGVFAGGVRIAA